jgi:hypothetical protein
MPEAPGTRPRGARSGPWASKLTPELQKRFIDALKVSLYIETAAAFAGITPQTVRNWIRWGHEEGGKRIYREFAIAVDQALAQVEMLDLQAIRAASKDAWQASAWRLERRFPERWGRVDRVVNEHMGPDGGPIQTEDVSQLSDAERAARVTALLELARDRRARQLDREPAGPTEVDPAAGPAD